MENEKEKAYLYFGPATATTTIVAQLFCTTNKHWNYFGKQILFFSKNIFFMFCFVVVIVVVVVVVFSNK